MSKEQVIKVSALFKKELDEIRAKKILNETAKFHLSERILTKAIVKSSKWPEVKDILIDADIRDDRRKNGYEQ